MTEPYLIAHLVRGQSAFDVAEQMPCPECVSIGCPECNDLGYWWIVGTSGHRAYPYGQWLIKSYLGSMLMQQIIDGAPDPASWPDHYPTRSAPKSSGSSLLAALSLHLPPQRSAPIKRRV